MRGLLITIALIGPILAIIFGTHALWTWLDTLWGASAASGIVSAVYLTVSSIAAIVVLSAGKPAVPAETHRSEGGSLLAVVESAVRRRPFESMTVMLGLGAIAAKNPGLVISTIRKML